MSEMAGGGSLEAENQGQLEKAANFLSAEYDYIAQTAFQANEDRARVSTFYIVTFGTLIAALFSLQVDNIALDNLHRALVVVFLTLTVFGLSTLLQLVRLRQAWAESVLALNQIKEFYLQQLQPMDVAQALRWNAKSIPPTYKPWSIAFLLALQVALLGGVSFGACIYFLSLVSGLMNWTVPVLLGFGYMIVQVWLYRRLLKN